jgi:ribosomal protein L34
MQSLRAVILAGFVCAALITHGAGATDTPKTLVATVGAGYTIRLQTNSGRTVLALRAGVYSIVVRDRSRMHNFHLSGPPTLSRRTGIAFVGTKRWVLSLTPGSYVFQCDRHPRRMRGSFRVV